MQDTIRKNLLQIQEEIAPYTPNIIAVTKYFDEEAIIAAYEAGLRNFGESRAAEAIKKIENLPDYIRNNSKFHFIGHLQTNKVKKVVGYFDYIHSVDSVKLAKTISEEAQQIGKVQKILLQINNANEEQKFGFSTDEIFSEFETIKKMPNLEILGLMNMAPLGADENVLENLFSNVVEIKKTLEEKFNCELKEISMGMSQDYKIAAKAGSTMLRVGRKLFNK
ncbi:MAG: YggS family pyridoxal phosphate-dependent enzyme [Candidatus Gastranaerophilaceae bacterium]